jgi:hypothetical protein
LQNLLNPKAAYINYQTVPKLPQQISQDQPTTFSRLLIIQSNIFITYSSNCYPLAPPLDLSLKTIL